MRLLIITIALAAARLFRGNIELAFHHRLSLC